MPKPIRRTLPIVVRAAALALCFSLLAAAVSAQPAPEEKTVVAIGDSRIYSDLTSAKNAAISEGLFFSVQKAAADLLSTDEITADFESVSALLVNKRNEFIQDYKIIREVRTDSNYRVLVQATIRMDRIRQELVSAGVKGSPDRMPTVLLMLAEQPLNSRDYQYWWGKGPARSPADAAGNPIVAILQEKGVPLVQPRVAGSGGENPSPDLGATPSNYDAARFARHLGADLVAVGTARVEPTSNRMGKNLRTMKAAVDIRVLRTDNGETLTTIREKAVTVGENPEITAQNALSDAAYQAGQQLAPRIVSLWSRAQASAGALTVAVSGENILPHLEKFRRALQSIPGVSSLQTRQITPSSATLEIHYKGSSQELADTLLLRSYEQFGINITDVSPDRLGIELLPKS